MTNTTNPQALRDRIRRAICEAEGFAWDPDMLEPDEYGEVADAVLAVLPAPADGPRRVAAEEQPAETQAPVEDPARIDRIRPEFTEHASIESIDLQLRRARAQERRWHVRVEWLISLRQARVRQKESGERPVVGEQPDTQTREA